MLSEKRDCTSVLKFFKKAIGSSGTPEKVKIDPMSAHKMRFSTVQCSKVSLRSLRFFAGCGNPASFERHWISSPRKKTLGSQ
jgi:transposase-like protein